MIRKHYRTIIILWVGILLSSFSFALGSIYNVKSGDTVTSIANKLGTSINVIEYNNRSVLSAPLSIGQDIKIYPQNAILYTVAKGDTINSIASTFFTTVSKIKSINHLKSNRISRGQQLLIPIQGSSATAAVGSSLNLSTTLDTSVYVVQSGDTLSEIANKFDTTVANLKTLNHLKSSHVKVGRKLKISNVGQGGYGIIKPTVTYPFGYQTFWPVEYEGVTSPFGMRIHPIFGTKTLHTGVDLRCDDQPVYAFAPGTVIFAGVLSGYGNVIMIDHGNGYQTRYAHLSSMAVTEGETVEEGEQIGVSGATGNVTGPHLHFEIRKNNVPLNPMDFFASSKVTDNSN